MSEYMWAIRRRGMSEEVHRPFRSRMEAIADAQKYLDGLPDRKEMEVVIGVVLQAPVFADYCDNACNLMRKVNQTLHIYYGVWDDSVFDLVDCEARCEEADAELYKFYEEWAKKWIAMKAKEIVVTKDKVLLRAGCDYRDLLHGNDDALKLKRGDG